MNDEPREPKDPQSPPPPEESSPHPPPQNVPAVRSREEVREEDIPAALQTLVDLERERLESNNRRSEVVRYAIETNDASDKRQFDYRMAKLANESKAGHGWFSLARSVVYVGLALATVGLVFLLWMIFFGDPTQSKNAVAILTAVGTALGGYGFIEAVKRAFARLFSRSGGS